MHPKNPFAKDYNFKELIAALPALKQYVFINQYGTETIKFADNKAVRALNTAILKLHYEVSWSIPDGNLCPPIPGRLDYLLYAAELFSSQKLHMLDIGTGANLVYPILASQHFGWTCVATELENPSFDHAGLLIEKNHFSKEINLRKQKYKSKIFETVILEEDEFDLVVCNPPFYKNKYEAEKKNMRKVNNLKLSEKEKLNFGGMANELWYKGGEEGFIKNMITESVQFKNQVHWFTSLVSNKEHLKNIKRAINKTKPKEVKIVEMEHGNKKSRFIAWTFR